MQMMVLRGSGTDCAKVVTKIKWKMTTLRYTQRSMGTGGPEDK